MKSRARIVLGVPLKFMMSLGFALLVPAALSSGQETAKTAAPAQKIFTTAKQAVDALLQACDSNDVTALKQILGPQGEDLVATADPVRDKNVTLAFAAKAREKNSISIDPTNANRAVLLVGNDNWPMPIPVVKRNGTWYFDTKAGRKEILYRRIGANELDAIEVCRNYVAAQLEYAETKHAGSDLNQYAQRILSTPGKQDGLAWRNADGSFGGPLAEGVADALAQGYTDKSKPFQGYYFKILKGEGPAAPIGKVNFVVEGAMIGGFALVAAPAEYRVTGVKTFIVSYEGTVYQQDLGPDTLKIFKAMELYNPDKSWQPTDDSWPADALDAPASAGN
jgi:Protein of unknown function (DUF2950)